MNPPANPVPAAAFLASEAGFRVLTDAMPQMVWSTLPDGYHDFYNAQWYAFTGMPEGSTDGEGWNGMFHPDDQDRAWERWRESLATGEPYEIEYRLRRHDGMYRWTLGRAMPVIVDGRIVRWIGTCTDIHETKFAAEQNELLSRELSHRIKNIFAVIAGLIELTSRARADHKPVLKELIRRVIALGRAHNFARPHSALSQPELPNSQLHGLLVALVAPYQDEAGTRVVLQTDEIRLDDRGATPLALIIHELATNAAKHGALKEPGGRITIRTQLRGPDVVLTWEESGGPRISEPPQASGFGSELIVMSAERQLAGSVTREWNPEGLRLTLIAPESNLHRGGNPAGRART